MKTISLLLLLPKAFVFHMHCNKIRCLCSINFSIVVQSGNIQLRRGGGEKNFECYAAEIEIGGIYFISEVLEHSVFSTRVDIDMTV